MRRINLLPREDRRRGLSGLPEAAVGTFAVAGAAIVLIVAAVSLFAIFRLNAIDNTVAQLDADIADRNQRLQELQPYSQLEGEIASKQPVADGVVRTRFPWDEFLRQLSFVIPATTTLQTLTAEAAPVDVNASVGQELQPPGAVTFTGFAQPDYTNVADFVLQMDTLRFLANSGINSAELDRDSFAQDAIAFDVGSELVTIVGDRESEARLEVDGSSAEDQYRNGGQASVVGGTGGGNELQ